VTVQLQRERRWELGDGWERASSGLYLPGSTPDGEQPATDLIGIDLFAGAGGFSLGFHQVGWHVAAAVEWDPSAAMTYLLNLGSPDTVLHFADRQTEQRWKRTLVAEAKRTRAAKLPAYRPGAGWIKDHPETKPVEHFYLGDIRKFTAEQVMNDLGIRRGECGCVFGGPPCQGFSMAGRREVMDPRNSLVFEFMHFVVAVKPKTFVMENVPGMVSMRTPEGVLVLDMLARIAQDGNFMTAENFKKTLEAQSDTAGFMRSDLPATRGQHATQDSGPDQPGEQLDLLSA